ncbi:MAG TPA: class I SAM-dependent methyltransferase [Pseudoxanthomonas sp.]|nr:class I SAM-dependent methyltransferase [Pseudoxanthomonas sp.]
MTISAAFLDEHHLRVGEVDFYCSYDMMGEKPVPDGFLPVAKDRDQIDRYLQLCDELRPEVIAELGIHRGGSTALLHALNPIRLLVAIELAREPAAALATYIETHGLESVVRPHYGINQADRAAVGSVMAAELAGKQIDLVIDDASHLLEETRISFETLFPLLRPGGVYVIEDWNAEHLMADGMNVVLADPGHPRHSALVDALKRAAALKPVPDVHLIRLALELVLARASSRDVIREVAVMNNWVVVRRGDEPIDPASFRLSDLVKDHFINLRPLG